MKNTLPDESVQIGEHQAGTVEAWVDRILGEAKEVSGMIDSLRTKIIDLHK